MAEKYEQENGHAVGCKERQTNDSWTQSMHCIEQSGHPQMFEKVARKSQRT